jgi:hypothetical protein
MAEASGAESTRGRASRQGASRRERRERRASPKGMKLLAVRPEWSISRAKKRD